MRGPLAEGDLREMALVCCQGLGGVSKQKKDKNGVTGHAVKGSFQCSSPQIFPPGRQPPSLQPGVKGS